MQTDDLRSKWGESCWWRGNVKGGHFNPASILTIPTKIIDQACIITHLPSFHWLTEWQTLMRSAKHLLTLPEVAPGVSSSSSPLGLLPHLLHHSFISLQLHRKHVKEFPFRFKGNMKSDGLLGIKMYCLPTHQLWIYHLISENGSWSAPLVLKCGAHLHNPPHPHPVSPPMTFQAGSGTICHFQVAAVVCTLMAK